MAWNASDVMSVPLTVATAPSGSGGRSPLTLVTFWPSAKGGLGAMLRRELQLREDGGQLVAEQAFRLLQRSLVNLDGLVKDVMQSCLLVRHPQP